MSFIFFEIFSMSLVKLSKVSILSKSSIVFHTKFVRGQDRITDKPNHGQAESRQAPHKYLASVSKIEIEDPKWN